MVNHSLYILFVLNDELAAEEKRGFVRLLRPDFQAPCAATAQQSEISLPGTDSSSSLKTENLTLANQVWPEGLPEQVAAVRKRLLTIGQNPEHGSAELAERLSACFGRKAKKRTDQITGILDTLKALGHI